MMDTETNIDVLESLDFEMDDECEHSQHSTRVNIHSGKGEWWALRKGSCKNCGFKPPVRLVCDTWKSYMCANPDDLLRCAVARGGCGAAFPISEFEYFFIRKDEA